MPNHVFITYEEIFGSRPDPARYDALVRSLNKRRSLLFLSRFNNLCSLFETQHRPAEAKELQVRLFDQLLSPEMHSSVDAYFANLDPNARPLFQRPSFLLLIKRVLRDAGDGDEGSDPFSDDKGRWAIGELCLMSNDEMQTQEQLDRLESDTPLEDGESDRILSELLTQMIPHSELMNPPDFLAATTRTLEYLKIYEYIATEKFADLPLYEFFERATGLSPTKLLYLTYGAYASVLRGKLSDFLQQPQLLHLNRNEVFKNLDFSKDDIDNFFRLIGRHDAGLVAAVVDDPNQGTLYEQYDFTQLRSKPFFHINEEVLTSIDISFVMEKVSYGLYHTFLTTIIEQGENPNKLFGEWGKMFEIYITKLFRRVYPEGLGRFFPNTYFDKSKSDMEAFDGLIDNFSSVFVFETKGGLMKANEKYSGDADRFLGELDLKFGKKDPKRSPIAQLVRKLEILFNEDPTHRFPLRELDLSRVKNIYPAIVVNDLSLQFGLCHWRLRKWFAEKISAANIRSDVWIHPVMILTVEDVETLIPYLESGDFTMEDFAHYYGRLEYMRYPWFSINRHWYEPMTTLRGVLTEFRGSRQIGYRPDLVLKDSFEKFSNSFADHFIR